MKTAISIPDALFDSAETLASRLGMSRSQLYATALARLLAEHERGQVTARLDAVYGGAGGVPSRCSRWITCVAPQRDSGVRPAAPSGCPGTMRRSSFRTALPATQVAAARLGHEVTMQKPQRRVGAVVGAIGLLALTACDEAMAPQAGCNDTSAKPLATSCVSVGPATVRVGDSTRVAMSKMPTGVVVTWADGDTTVARLGAASDGAGQVTVYGVGPGLTHVAFRLTRGMESVTGSVPVTVAAR